MEMIKGLVKFYSIKYTVGVVLIHLHKFYSWETVLFGRSTVIQIKLYLHQSKEVGRSPNTTVNIYPKCEHKKYNLFAKFPLHYLHSAGP